MHSTELKNRPLDGTRIIFLDGIRGWASFAVLLSHTIVCFLAPSTPQLAFDKNRLTADISDGNYADIVFGLFFQFITDGHLAVLIFFVLSGYALSARHLDLRTKNLALATTSRYFRLMLPIFFTSLIAYFLLKLGLFSNLEAASTPEYSKNWLGTFYKFEANLKDVLLFSLFDVFFRFNGATTYNASLWTMPVELLGSALIYGYLGIFRTLDKINWKILAPLTIMLMAFVPLYACFFAGYIIAELNRSFRAKIAVAGSKYFKVAMLVLFTSAAFLSVFLRGNDKITFLIATALVLSVSFSPPLESFFSNSVSRFLGKISFPLYLIQLPIICSWSSYLFIRLPQLGMTRIDANYVNLLTTIALCLVASTLLVPVEAISVKYSKKLGAVFLGSQTV